MNNIISNDNEFFFPFPGPLVKGKIIVRYKRFLADVELDSGEVITSHIASCGSMETCWEAGASVVMTRLPDDGKRKLKYSLQAIKMSDGWIGVNTLNPNRAVVAAVKAGKIKELTGYKYVQSEVKTFTGSRFDLAAFTNFDQSSNALVSINQKRAQIIDDEIRQNLPICLVEVKNATLKESDGVLFPDAKTARGQKHLLHLIEMKKNGFRSIILFFAGRDGASWVSPADLIDPNYGKLLRLAMKNGVEALALRVKVTESGMTISGTIPVIT